MRRVTRSRANRLAGLVALASLAYPAAALCQAKATLDSIAGVWCGSARIVVNWTVQKRLGVRVWIDPAGNVSGRVGDAQLVGGRLKTNRGAIGRMLRVKTDYIIVGSLEGPIIAAEGIRRARVTMPLTWTQSAFEGALHTDGRKFGGKEEMGLTASDLILRRWIVPAKRAAGFC